ncbi:MULTISPECIES: hypothetical protein [unclassified Pseudomonas]|uniref:hypothetical protein n=1 Tax=unclassified Pseudomonas TaxID=196821 RepID=UPI001CC1AE95|nr:MULTISPECIES: hypothetical protein [unclassified Pseudomonas]
MANAIGAIEILTATKASKFSVRTQYSFHRTLPVPTARSGSIYACYQGLYPTDSGEKVGLGFHGQKVRV